MQKEERKLLIAACGLFLLSLVLLTVAPTLGLFIVLLLLPLLVPLLYLLFVTVLKAAKVGVKPEETLATVEELRAKLPERPSSVPLNPSEVIVLKDVAVTVRHMRAPRGERDYFEGDWERVYEFVNVYLSNERLIVDVVPPLTIPLEKIEGCTVAERIAPFDVRIGKTVEAFFPVIREATVGELLYIYAYVEGPWKHFVFELLDARRWRDEIERLRAARVEELRRRERPVIVDFSALRDILERGGISTFVPKCPNCGAPIQLPESGESVKCPYCGATIYAKDVLERLKELLLKLA
jgi:DNA-directed RNA polymerase subunit RPC12/RpoP